MFAIIHTGGKQYLVSEGTKVKVEKLQGEPGDAVQFDQVLFAGNDETVQLGSGKKKLTVKATILRHDRHPKVTGIKHKAKKRYKMKFGHRQTFTEVEINKIG